MTKEPVWDNDRTNIQYLSFFLITKLMLAGSFEEEKSRNIDMDLFADHPNLSTLDSRQTC